MAGQSRWQLHDYAATFDLRPESYRDNCERVDEAQLPPEAFVERYEKLYKPVVVRGSTDRWKATYKWTLSVSLQPQLSSLSIEMHLGGTTDRSTGADLSRT